MSNSITMPFHRVINMLRNAEISAFSFSNNEKRIKKLSDNRKETLNHIGGKTSPFWIFMSIIGILAAVGFGIYAAFNAQGAIAGIVDPMADGRFPLWLYLVIGSAISIVGMLFGHFIYDGLSDGFKTDTYTGQRLPSSKLWLAIVGFVGATVYVYYQFTLVKSAGNGNTNFASMPYVVAGIAILELLIGALILHRAFTYLLLFFTSIAMWIITRQMNSNARNTNNNYRDYLNFINAYNRENPTDRMQVEGNDNIRRAIAFYTGTNLHQADSDNVAAVQPADNNNAENNSPRNSSDNTSTDQQHRDSSTQENLSSFINDTIDEDLTA